MLEKLIDYFRDGGLVLSKEELETLSKLCRRNEREGKVLFTELLKKKADYCR